MTTARHEIVVFGATSFVGQILCRNLIEQSDSGERLGWAMAGRSAAKLEALRNPLGASAAKVRQARLLRGTATLFVVAGKPR